MTVEALDQIGALGHDGESLLGTHGLEAEGIAGLDTVDYSDSQAYRRNARIHEARQARDAASTLGAEVIVVAQLSRPAVHAGGRALAGAMAA